MTLLFLIRKNLKKWKNKKRKKQKGITGITTGISAIAGSVFELVLVVFVLQPHLSIEDNYLFEKFWGTSDKSNFKFDKSSGIALYNKGNLYVTDTWNDRIQKRHPDWI